MDLGPLINQGPYLNKFIKSVNKEAEKATKFEEYERALTRFQITIQALEKEQYRIVE